MSLIAGIDYDSGGVYIVTVDEDTGELDQLSRIRLAAFNGQTDTSFERVRCLTASMPARASWRDAGVVAIGIEDPYSRFPEAIKAEARVQGAILACLPVSLPIYALKPHTRNGWKAAVGLKTNASKDEIRVWAQANGCPPAIRQDYYDAFCIARAARALHHAREARSGRALATKGT